MFCSFSESSKSYSMLTMNMLLNKIESRVQTISSNLQFDEKKLGLTLYLTNSTAQLEVTQTAFNLINSKKLFSK